MKSFASFASAALLLLPAASTAQQCAPVTTAPNFDLTMYVSKPWYVQQQAVTQYLPIEDFNCVRAQYEEVGGFWGTFPWRYTVRVSNEAQDADGNKSGGGLCAYNRDESDPAKLAVAPCFLPQGFAGDYWVIAYNETKGYALVSGGQPTIQTENGCKTGDGTNESGLWVFTREQNPDPALVTEVRTIAANQGFDLTVLQNVNQSGCTYSRRLEEEDKQLRGSS